MADQQEASVTLPSEAASVPEARAFVAALLREWGLPEGEDLTASVRLIVSELVTNAVLHTGERSPFFTVTVSLDREELLRVGVTDSHPRPPRRLPAAVQQDNGRGLAIIRFLTAENGGRLSVVPTPQGGKTVLVALPWSPARAAAVPEN
ncbi:ATP-binding protein [Streptomyces sp. SPB074]|uniref:ATP-binding protein n=1 Tax=Streptomyces sp. (strain SPB074) TaxID=465543 RepID=UPI00055F52F4|nr:ATP-binding protein [Streptomyces sp. SPB074]